MIMLANKIAQASDRRTYLAERYVEEILDILQLGEIHKPLLEVILRNALLENELERRISESTG